MVPVFADRHVSALNAVVRLVAESSRHCHALPERVALLAEAATKLDAFALRRLPRLQRADGTEADGPSHAGRATVRQRLDDVEAAIQDAWRLLRKDLLRGGVAVLADAELTRRERESLQELAIRDLLPTMTPVTIDPAHPFPAIRSLDVAVAIELVCQRSRDERLVVVRIPAGTPRFVTLPDFYGRGMQVMVGVEQCLLSAADSLFRHHLVRSAGAFRLVRDIGAPQTTNDDDEALSRQVARSLRKRAHRRAIRLEVSATLQHGAVQALRKALGVGRNDVVVVPDLLAPCDLATLVEPEDQGARPPTMSPRRPTRAASSKVDLFARLREQDLLLHHPFETTDVVVDLLRQAARDPDVVAIRQSLYRACEHEGAVEALVEASESGKSVTALVELRAPFHEEANLRCSRRLERAGVQVVHGVKDLAMHAGLTVIIRKEADGLAPYACFGHAGLPAGHGRRRDDVSLLTADPELGRDATRLFHFATGYCDLTGLQRLVASPGGLRPVLMDLIEEEVRHVRAGRPGQIWLQCNALTDRLVIEALYRASGEGVEIDALISGPCSLRPGLAGLSERIRVRALVGLVDSHARLFAFGGGWGLPHPRAKAFLCSADLTTGSLDRRLETLVPIRDPGAHERIVSIILASHLADTARSWIMLPDGSSERIDPGPGQEAFDAQARFAAGSGVRPARPTEPGPARPFRPFTVGARVA